MVSPNGFLPSQAAPVFLTQDGTVVDNSNPLAVAATFSGTISASSAAQANAAPPVWTEGSLEPFSQNLHGALRITPSITGTDLTTFPVSGTVTAQGTLTIIPSGTQTVTGSLTVTQATGTNLHTVVDSGTISVTGTPTITGAVTLAAGTNLAGKVGIDQTTVGSTNGFNVNPTSASGAGLTPVVTAQTLESGHVLKGSAGNLWSVYVTNTGTTAGYLFAMNSTTVPADGTLTSGVLLDCIAVGTLATGGINYAPGPPSIFSTGISVCFSSTAPPIKTALGSCFFNGKIA